MCFLLLSLTLSSKSHNVCLGIAFSKSNFVGSQSPLLQKRQLYHPLKYLFHMLYFLLGNTNYMPIDFLCISSKNVISSNTIYPIYLFSFWCGFSQFSTSCLSPCFQPGSFYFLLPLNFPVTL